MRNSVIIPARGGSKGIPGKNIKELLGKPLIQHSIEDALESESVDEIYVTTDDKEIAEIAAQAGADIITRPEFLSGDTATTESAIEHALSVIPQNRKPDNIILLQPTSPLRPAGAIDEACSIFSENSFDSLLSIS
ncbi:MAG: cytidylyltransferase domain-containing protein, partial [Chitinivibrionales bacterium]